MKSPISTIIQGILLEVAIDTRVPTGMVDINDNLHREIIAEKLAARGIDRQLVVEVVNKLAIRDGKYPDRQAYNKDGWLVTFPTPDHKAAAIKKRTAFASDPTHGSGGMNLYYKQHGKQARQKSQGSSEVGGGAQQTSTQPKSGGAVSPTPTAQGSQPETTSTLSKSGSSQATAPTTTGSGVATGATSVDATEPTEQPQPVSTGTSSPTAPTQSPATQSNSQATQPASTESQIVKLSVEFARSKSWRDAPYGDWTNEKGEQIAVTGLDGQVVPIRFVDREELKSFAEKRISDGTSLREEFRRILGK